MKELLILSGKGGTGKTTLAGSFCHLFKDKVIADCDVDGSDLPLILNNKVREKNDFISGVKAEIDSEKCTGCNLCAELCQFDAVVATENGLYEIDDFSCEGCGVCSHFCPENAIELHPNHCGHWFISSTEYGTLIHAELMPGEENSGKLVSLVKEKARMKAESQGKKLILVDGPPGIGCPVISSISGADFIVIVTEPTISGLHDLKRVIELATHFKVRHGAVINKWDLNEKVSKEIEKFLEKKAVPFLGKIPFDKSVVEATIQGKNIIKFKHCKAGESIANIWLQVVKKLEEEKK